MHYCSLYSHSVLVTVKHCFPSSNDRKQMLVHEHKHPFPCYRSKLMSYLSFQLNGTSENTSTRARAMHCLTQRTLAEHETKVSSRGVQQTYFYLSISFRWRGNNLHTKQTETSFFPCLNSFMLPSRLVLSEKDLPYYRFHNIRHLWNLLQISE